MELVNCKNIATSRNTKYPRSKWNSLRIRSYYVVTRAVILLNRLQRVYDIDSFVYDGWILVVMNESLSNISARTKLTSRIENEATFSVFNDVNILIFIKFCIAIFFKWTNKSNILFLSSVDVSFRIFDGVLTQSSSYCIRDHKRLISRCSWAKYIKQSTFASQMDSTFVKKFSNFVHA